MKEKDLGRVLAVLVMAFILSSVLYVATELNFVTLTKGSSSSFDLYKNYEEGQVSKELANTEYRVLHHTEYEVEEKSRWLNFQATAYCPCTICCGPDAAGITASGKPVEAQWTVAADPDVIPLGTIIEVEGLGTYEVQDTGSAINGQIIDIYFDTHDEALDFGRQEIRLRVTD